MSRSSLLHVLAQLHDQPWAIKSETLDWMIEIVGNAGNVDLDAVAAKLGRPLENSGNRTEIRDGVGILGVTGPLFRRANLLTEISGASSVQMMARDFQAMLDHPQVKSILLEVDSPGGQIDGIEEFANQIRAGSKIKPVTAYVGETAASAGYWLAAAAPRIVAANSSLLGSIGVVASMRDNRAAQEKQGVRTYEIVSSKSPFKRPDPSTDEGRSQILAVVDKLADIFIGHVASLRGVSADAVEARFGQGRMMVGADAVEAGMADEIGTYEPLVARLAAESLPRAVAISVKEKIPMKAQEDMIDCPQCDGTGEVDGKKCPKCNGEGKVPADDKGAKTNQPAVTGRVGGITAVDINATERSRIAAILDAPEATGREQLARMLALETNMPVEQARKILAGTPVVATSPRPNPLAERMASMPNPKVGAGQEEDTEAAAAASILAFAPKRSLRAS